MLTEPWLAHPLLPTERTMNAWPVFCCLRAKASVMPVGVSPEAMENCLRSSAMSFSRFWVFILPDVLPLNITNQQIVVNGSGATHWKAWDKLFQASFGVICLPNSSW